VALDWSTITAEHVKKAGSALSAERSPSSKTSGLFVVVEDKRLPAKPVLRMAYCLANRISLESAPKFSSGEATLRVLQRLGFAVERVPLAKSTS